MLLGSKNTATQRLNLAQAFNPVGVLFGLMAAQLFILGSLQSDNMGAKEYAILPAADKAFIKSSDLAVIRDPYVVLGLVVLLLMLVFALSKMPKIVESKSQDGMKASIQRLFRKPHFVEGFIAEVFYAGAQICCWTYIYQYAENLGINNKSAVNYAYVALILFLIGR